MAWLLTYISDLWQLFLAVAFFTALEVAMPRGRASWLARLQAIVFNGIYFAFAAGAAVAAGWIGDWLHIRPLIVTDSLWAVLAYPIAWDFFYYWFHRTQHVVPALWKLHCVHHSIRDLNAANSYHHWSEELLRTVAIGLPLMFLIRITPAEFGYVSVFFLAAGTLIHTQTAFSLGPLSRVLADNRTHRVHHSLEERHFDRNFGLTMLWDQLFRTAYFPRKDEWPAVGLPGREETGSVIDYLLAHERSLAGPEQLASFSAETSTIS